MPLNNDFFWQQPKTRFMKIVTVFLRSVVYKDKHHLALFDSNRNGAIDDLTTEVKRGATIIWKLDYSSGIKDILRIFSKSGKRNVFKTDPVKRRFSKEFILPVSKDADGEESYTIEYLNVSDEKVTIDPYNRIVPPK